MSLLTEGEPPKVPCFTIAEEEGEEEEEEEETGYVKPAPQPKAESMSCRPGLSWMLMLLLVSGGVFLWRRSRRNQIREEDDAEVLIQRTQELLLEPLPPGAAPETNLAADAAGENSRETPDFEKGLVEQDEMFGVDRDLKVERTTSGIESLVTPEDLVLPEPDSSEAPGKAEDLAPVPVVAPAELQSMEDTPAETYYADLDHKDEVFPDERMSQQKDLNPAAAAASASSILVMSPTSQIDEGSNQSATTHFSGARSPEAPESPPATTTKEIEDFDFETLPKKHALIEEDLGPPIKPTAIDFTKPSEWEDMAPVKTKGAGTDDKTQTMQYLFSNAALLTEALKKMESGSAAIDAGDLRPQVPDEAQPKSSSKKKKKRSKKKKSTSISADGQ